MKSFSIALAGKGGTGKTTVAGMLVKYLVEKGKGPVLAVDADANANLNDVLGLEVADTLGNAREEMKRGDVPSGMTKDIFMEMKLEQAVMEAAGYDLVVMGQPESAGCYCAANTLLTGFLERLSGNYPFIVMDNEAGMEHISRRTTKGVDLLLIVTDPTVRGVRAAASIAELAGEVDVEVRRMGLIVNRVQGDLPEPLRDAIEELGVEVLSMIPADPRINEADAMGESLLHLNGDSPAWEAIDSLMGELAAHI